MVDHVRESRPTSGHVQVNLQAGLVDEQGCIIDIQLLGQATLGFGRLQCFTASSNHLLYILLFGDRNLELLEGALVTVCIPRLSKE